MNDDPKTKAQLLGELAAMRQSLAELHPQINELEALGTHDRRKEETALDTSRFGSDGREAQLTRKKAGLLRASAFWEGNKRSNVRAIATGAGCLTKKISCSDRRKQSGRSSFPNRLWTTESRAD